MSAYDAAYAAAAEALDTALITTDARLLGACRAAGIGALTSPTCRTCIGSLSGGVDLINPPI